MSYTLPPGMVLCLRTLRNDMRDGPGFLWPESGVVSAPIWIPTRKRNNGLLGLLWGEGSVDALFWQSRVKWVVVEVASDTIVDLGGLAKFPSGTVVFVGDQAGATAFLADYAPPGTKVTGGIVSAGVGGTATVGDRGTATAGDNGTAVAEDSGTATVGSNGTAIAGVRGTAIAGAGGTATSGERGTATAGDNGTAIAGDNGTATAGNSGTAAAGVFGVATVGVGGKASAGDGGAILIQYWNGTAYEYKSAAVGGVGHLTPNTLYELDGSGNFVPA